MVVIANFNSSQILREEALVVFEKWKDKKDKIGY